MKFIPYLRIISICTLLTWLAGCATDPQAGNLAQNSQATTIDDDVVIDNMDAAFTIYKKPEAEKIDLWQRMRNGFAMADLKTDVVTEKEQWYLARPRYLVNTGGRAQRYLYYIIEELEKREMPMELALLPFIESSFDPQAVSIAQAAGMWQFIPSTGRNFSLQQDMFRDDRRDVIASTNAALDYLQKLYAMFGDWHLALAAYNWGEGNVLRAIERNQRAGKPTDYANLNLPRETQGYVPMLQALKNVIVGPDTFKMEVPRMPNHPYFQILAVERDIDVSVAAELAQVSVEDFKALNPAVNKPVILAEITPQILLPWESAETFMENLGLYKGRLSSWTVWRAPRTMSVTQVARTTGMTEAALREVNDIPPQVLVKEGSALLVHRAEDNSDNVALSMLKNASLNLAMSGGRRFTPSKIAVEVATNSATSQTTTASRQSNSTPSKVAVNAQGVATTTAHANSESEAVAITAGTTAAAVTEAPVAVRRNSTPSKVAANDTSREADNDNVIATAQ